MIGGAGGRMGGSHSPGGHERPLNMVALEPRPG